MTLGCGEIASLVRLAQDSNAVLVAIRAAAPDLVELTLKPALNAMARCGVVTLARRAKPPALSILRKLVAQLMAE